MSSLWTSFKEQVCWLTVLSAALQAGHIGQAMPSLSTCSTDSRQDYISTTDSRGPRGSRPPRRAAAVAALEHNHLVFGSPSPGAATDASPSPLVSPKHPHMHEASQRGGFVHNSRGMAHTRLACMMRL